MILIIGISAATWTVVKPNLSELPAFDYLCHNGDIRTMFIKEKPVSPALWCEIFCGAPVSEHKHTGYVADDRIVKRENIRVNFLWDFLDHKAKKAFAVNIPLVVPPYNFRTDYRPVGFGLPTNETEWNEELERLTAKIKELMADNPDLLVACYTLLDRVQHFHWGEPVVLEWYKKLDDKLREILIDSGFLENKDNHLIIVSEHGFCAFADAKIQTLPMKSDSGVLKGEHHENALLITVNVDYDINSPREIFDAVMNLSHTAL